MCRSHTTAQEPQHASTDISPSAIYGFLTTINESNRP
jgi:hypothetical protein